ncbi:MAG: hypothetical protein WD766_11330 [Gemmatimonadota bacterium]
MSPYELVFTEGDFESRVFPRIRTEAEAQEVDALRRERFDFLSTAGEVVRQVTPEEAPPEALEQYRALLFHAYHFWHGGKRLYALDAAVARYLVETAPRLAEWEFSLPSSSVYLQLPANLFWSSISPETPPEPVDGFFVTTSDVSDPLGEPAQQIEILLVLGIRKSRAGFSVIPLLTETGRGIMEAWGAEGREDGDFTTDLPGGDIDGLYSILTTGEVLKLVGRVFWYIDSFPEGLVEVPALENVDDDDGPPASHLEYVRITLSGGGEEEPA